jgi:hypothetical protein
MSNINSIHDHLERIGMIGSPSTTTELTLDILQSAVNKKLIGELATFKFIQDGKDHYAIGQITEVELRNVWLEGASLRSIARQKGTVNPVSEQQDTHIGQMTVSAVFSQESEGFEQSMLGTVPATGTYIKIASDELLQKLLEKQQRQLFYLGNVYGSTPLLPMTFRHFGRGENGAGEAYHIGVFGKTGSGKSTLTKMVLSAYMRFPELGILILDPQGEFSKDFNSNTSEDFKVPLKEIAQNNNKKTVVLSVKNLILDTWDLFEEILNESPFFEKLTIPKGYENYRIACETLKEELKKKDIKLAEIYKRETFDLAFSILLDEEYKKNQEDDKKTRKKIMSIQQLIYKGEKQRERFDDALNSANREEFYKDYWLPIGNLFKEQDSEEKEQKSKRRTIAQALWWLLSSKSVLVVDLSNEQADGIFWNERIQAMVIKRLLDSLIHLGGEKYKKNEYLNTLVVIDEAHRLAKRESVNDDTEKSVKNILIRASRETRKYGLGWMFISQTLASLDKEIINQLRISFFGFGLSMGMEFQSLKELAGGDANALKLYQSFRDPHSTLNPKNKQYSFMTIGPVSPLSFAGTPLFFTAFNDIKTFLERNGLQKQ